MPHVQSATPPAQKSPIESLAQYKSVTIQENVWKGRLIRVGIIVGAIILVAAAAAAVGFGIMTGNPLFIGIGLAVGTCVIIGTISYFSIDAALPDKERRVLELQAATKPFGNLLSHLGFGSKPKSSIPSSSSTTPDGDTGLIMADSTVGILNLS